MTTPIMTLVEKIREEADTAIICFGMMNTEGVKEKDKRINNDKYVESVRNIQELANAIGKLNSI